MKLGEIMKELLEQHNITQKQLAEALDISPSALGNYIQCRREPDFRTLICIADFFHVTTDFLLDHVVQNSISHDEELLLHIYRSLEASQQEFYLEQGKIFIRQNAKKESSNSPVLSEKNYRVIS